MTESLTQEQIDAMMNGTLDQTSLQSDEGMDQTMQDIIGEVGNISMSQAATTLSAVLDRRVSITTPRVSYIPFKEVLNDLITPKVATIVEFKEGLLGSNLMLLDVRDAIIISNLMLGGDGHTDQTEFTELELSAVGEAMNQMIGSASTSMATMIGKKVDILPPNVTLWDAEEKVHVEGIDLNTKICKISFDLTVEGVIESEIMQIFTQEVVSEITEIMLADTAVELADRTPEVMPEEPATFAESVKPTSDKISVQKPEFQELSNHAGESKSENLDLIMDVPLDFSVVLGKSRKTIKEILSLGNGSVVELDKLTDEPLEVYVNGKLIAQGEVVVINENFGVRITNILSQKQRLSNLH